MITPLIPPEVLETLTGALGTKAARRFRPGPGEDEDANSSDGRR